MITRRFVVDASVAIKWVIEEADSALAAALTHCTLFAPEFFLIECSNAIWRRALRGDVPEDAVHALLMQLRGAPLEALPTEELLDDALRLSMTLRHPVYDCLYLALALVRSARVVSADRRFVAAVRRNRDLASQVVLLAELAH